MHVIMISQIILENNKIREIWGQEEPSPVVPLAGEGERMVQSL